MCAWDDGKGSYRQVPVQDLHMTLTLLHTGRAHMDAVLCRVLLQWVELHVQ